jgi:phenylacetate-CoA ligase
VDPELHPRLAAHLAFVASRSPYYARRRADPRDLGSFPVLTKRAVRENVGTMLTSANPSDRDALAAELLRDSLPGEQNRAGELRYNGEIVIDQTTGTSGIPARFPKTNAERAELALAGFMRRRLFDPELKPARFVPLLHHRWDQRFDFDIWSPDPGDIARLYRWLAERKARWIHIPSILIGRHAAALEKAGVAEPVPGLRFLEATGSRLAQEAVDAARRVFKAETVNQYGTIEMWAIAYAVGTGPFEPNAAAVHVELVDDDERPIAEPGVEGDIVVTNLVLRLLPLVRYRTGDRGSWVDVPGPGGAPARRLVLAAERDVNKLFVDGRRISGTEAFRPILRRVYSRVGYSGVAAVQISQIGAEKLRLSLNRSERAEEICRVFLDECRKLRAGLEVEFDLREADDLSFLDRKGNLFVNRWGFPGPNPSV